MFKTGASLRRIVTCLGVALVFVACGGDGGSGSGSGAPAAVPTTLVPAPSPVLTVAIGTALESVPSVTLKDQYGAGMANVWIQWTPSSGNIFADSSLTNANGTATSGTWTLGTVSGLQTLTARAGALSVVAMAANVSPGPMVGLVTVSTTVTGVVGSTLSTPASVKAVDKYGNGVPNIFVQFAMWAGNGSITGNRQATNENGIATVGSWKLGPLSGQQSIRADDHITGATTMVHATALPAPASQFVVIDGNAQTGQAGKRLCTSPIIAVRDQYGNGIGQIPIVFTPGAGSGTVTEASVVSNAGNGYAAVGTWTLSGSVTQTLVVTSPAVPGASLTLTATVAPGVAFSVCTRYLGASGTPRQRQAVTTAVQRWQRVIAGHAQTSTLAENANRCFPGQPAINEVVEDLLLFVQIAPMDGPGTMVARAGPCAVHLPSGLTQMGLLQLDSADLELLLGQGTLDNLVTHELGHVLGFGTLWYSQNVLSGAGTNDPFFTGASARAQFALLPNSYAGTPVPVEGTGEIGTRDAHWRHAVFNTELMQGFTAPNMPMSRVTVGSLADLGYVVDVSKADAFSFPSTARASTTTATALVRDVLDADIWGSTKNGRRVLVQGARNPLVWR